MLYLSGWLESLPRSGDTGMTLIASWGCEETRRGSHMCEGDIMMWWWYHDVWVISWSWCVSDIMMWEWYHTVMWWWYHSIMCEWYHSMMCEWYHDVRVISGCERDITMREWYHIMMWGWYHDVRVISWSKSDIMMWELYQDVGGGSDIIPWCEGDIISWCEGDIIPWCASVLVMCECWCWGWEPLISDMATTKTRPGRRLSSRPRLLALNSARTRGEEWPAAVLLHCHTVTLLHCTLGNHGEHRQIKLSDWLYIKVSS